MPRAGETVKFRWRDRLRLDARVPDRVIRIGFAVSDRMDSSGEQLEDYPPTVRWLMKRTGCNERKVQRHLRILERLGYLDVLHAGGGSQGDVRVYKLAFPGVVVPLQQTAEPAATPERVSAILAESRARKTPGS